MSSNGVAADPSQFDFRKGLAVIGVCIAFLATLVVLRFGCNIFIDLAVLQDSGSLIRALSEIRRKLIPWWHPRTQPQQSSSQIITSPASADELINMDRVLAGLTPHQKKELIGSILTTKVS